jgi:hypothetical protein
MPQHFTTQERAQVLIKTGSWVDISVTLDTAEKRKSLAPACYWTQIPYSSCCILVYSYVRQVVATACTGSNSAHLLK